MAVTRTIYGLSTVEGEDLSEQFTSVYKIEEEHDGTVWVTMIGGFYDREVAHAFCRAWNGEPGPA